MNEPVDDEEDQEPQPPPPLVLRMIGGSDALTCDGDGCALPGVSPRD